MDMTKELVCKSLRKQLIMFRIRNMIIIGTRCCISIMESLNFKMAKLLKLGANYS